MTVVGTRRLRREDPVLLTGEARFVDDLPVTGALHVKVVRSPFAHATIRSIDTEAARAMPGVVAVYTGADLRDDWQTPLPCAWPVTDDMKNPEHYPLAVSEVCFVGDGVAVVVAESAAAARDAMEAIVVDYDELPAAFELEDAVSDTRAGASRPRHEHFVPLGAQARRGRGQPRLRRRGAHGERALRAPAPHPDGHGAARRVHRARAVRRRRHHLLVDADPPHPQDPARGDARPRRASGARGRARGRRRFRFEAQRVRRRGDLPRHREAVEATGPVDRGAHREHAGHRARSRDDPDDRAGRRRRRPHHRGARAARRRHGRLPATRHSRHPVARRVHLPRRLRRYRRTRSRAPASSPTRRRPTRTAVPDGRRRRTRSSGPSTRSPA